MKMSKLQQYKLAAFQRAMNRTPGKVLNDGIDCANILIDSMIGWCLEGDEIFIYTGKLPQNSYFGALQSTPASKITVILDDDTCIQWLADLPESALSKITLYKIRQRRPSHFFFTSSGAFRLERDGKNFQAEGDFNNPRALPELNNAFNVLLADSDLIEKPSCTPAQGCESNAVGI